MLIAANALLSALEEKRRAVMEGTFEAPPTDYAKFMQAVGRVQELTAAMELVKEAARMEDDR